MLFFGIYAEFFWLVCQHCTLRVHRIVFTGSIFFEENASQIIFCILDGDFPGFRRNFSSTVVRTALDSRFLFGFMSIFFEICTILLAGLSDLQSTCPLDCFYGKRLVWKKNIFSIVFHFLRGNFRFLSKSFPAR